MAVRSTPLRSHFGVELPRLYAVTYAMCGDREQAFRFLAATCPLINVNAEKLLAAPKPGDALLGLIARKIEFELQKELQLNPETEQTSFLILDNVLRTEVTQPINVETPGIDGDMRRIHAVLWELKRTCLTAVLGCLPPASRLSFIFTDLMGYDPAEASHLLEVKESAYRVRLTRARKRLEDYLTPRCYHVDRENTCICENRLGVALDAKFVVPPPHDLDTPKESYKDEPARRDIDGIYRGLPPVVLTAAQSAALLERITT